MKLFKISLNLKLIIIIVFLISITLGYLIHTSLTMQINDKLNNSLQNQLTENKFLGEKLTSKIDNSITTLKNIALIKETDKNYYSRKLKEILKNQNELNKVLLIEVDKNDQLEMEFQSENISEMESETAMQWVENKINILKNKKFAFSNLTISNKNSQIGVMLIDSEYYKPDKVLVLVGVTSLSNLNKDLTYDINVSDETGWQLYSSDITGIFSKNIQNNKLYKKSINSKVNSGTIEFIDNDRKYLGSFYKTKHNLIIMAKQPMIKIMSGIYSLIQKIILTGLFALCIGIILAIKLAKTITNPIEELCSATEQIAEGNFDIKLKIGDNEVGVLGKSFEKMSSKLQDLLKEQVKKIRLEQELNIAATVQKTLLPEANFANDIFTIKSHYASANECGGDIWQYFIKNNKMVIMIADATGHGLGSAFVTVSARTVFSVIKSLTDRDLSLLNHPSFILEEANNAIYDVSKGSIMMTLFLAIIDLSSGECKYVNAGHNSPWIFRKNGKVDSLTSPGVRLGENPVVKPFVVKSTHLNNNDQLFLYTDGIIEGTNIKGDVFGKKQVRKLIENNLNKGLDFNFNNLIKQFNLFSKNKSLDDDVTAVLIEFKNISERKEAA